MTKFLDLVQENNAAAFKQHFEETVAEKTLEALEEMKKKVASQMHKHINHNPYRDNKTQLQQDVRGFIGQSSIDHPGGFANAVKEGARTDASGLNADELNKGPGMGGGFTNEVPVKKISKMPEVKSGSTVSSYKR